MRHPPYAARLLVRLTKVFRKTVELICRASRQFGGDLAIKIVDDIFSSYFRWFSFSFTKESVDASH